LLRGEYKAVEIEFKQVGEQQMRTAGQMVRGNQQIADSTKKAADSVHESGEKVVASHKRTCKEQTDLSKLAFEGLGQAMIGIGASFFTLRTAVDIIKELEAHTKEVIEARIKLGEIKIGVDERIQSVIDNLGFLPGAAGQTRARGLVQSLQSRAGGTSAEVAAEILARGQATGFKVADVNRPDLDTKAPAFGIAVDVAQVRSAATLRRGYRRETVQYGAINRG
jgi:hypothetical protein